MPSLLCMSQSGGIGLVSGNIYSGYTFPYDVTLKLTDTKGSRFIYIGLPPLSGTHLSGFITTNVTITSGGSLSSGGLFDGMELSEGGSYGISKSRLMSGIESIRVGVPAISSGILLFWEFFTFLLSIGIGMLSSVC